MKIDTLGQADEKSADLRLLANLRARLAAITFDGPAQLVAIITTPKHNVHKPASGARLTPGVGVEGDRPYKQHWRGKRRDGRQISAMNAEVLDALDVGYDVPGDNLIVRGIDLAEFEESDTLRVGDAILIATGRKHNPCRLFIERTSTAHYVAIAPNRRRGTMFDCLHAATIKVGDPVERIVCYNQPDKR